MAREPRFQTIDGEELYRKLAFGDPLVVVDVRTESEYAARHIPGSLLVPLHELESHNLKGLLRRTLGKIFNDVEIKGWCKEHEQLNAAILRRPAEAVPA